MIHYIQAISSVHLTKADQLQSANNQKFSYNVKIGDQSFFQYDCDEANDELLEPYSDTFKKIIRGDYKSIAKERDGKPIIVEVGDDYDFYEGVPTYRSFSVYAMGHYEFEVQDFLKDYDNIDMYTAVLWHWANNCTSVERDDFLTIPAILKLFKVYCEKYLIDSAHESCCLVWDRFRPLEIKKFRPLEIKKTTYLIQTIILANITESHIDFEKSETSIGNRYFAKFPR
jgi:hypothetical protein